MSVKIRASDIGHEPPPLQIPPSRDDTPSPLLGRIISVLENVVERLKALEARKFPEQKMPAVFDPSVYECVPERDEDGLIVKVAFVRKGLH